MVQLTFRLQRIPPPQVVFILILSWSKEKVSNSRSVRIEGEEKRKHSLKRKYLASGSHLARRHFQVGMTITRRFELLE